MLLSQRNKSPPPPPRGISRAFSKTAEAKQSSDDQADQPRWGGPIVGGGPIVERRRQRPSEKRRAPAPLLSIDAELADGPKP